MLWRVMLCVLACLPGGSPAAAAESAGTRVAPGIVHESVACAADARQSYALYLPGRYRADAEWPVIFLFDPGARGADAVRRMQAGAERFGYIVVASHNSRNGQSPSEAVAALLRDVLTRFSIDTGRMYTGGMSGGARVAMAVALLPQLHIAGVLAASAAYPDATPRSELPFVVFATAGSEDFNLVELHEVGAQLRSPFRLAEFSGPHTWPPPALLEQALGWFELQAMRRGARARDPALIEALFAERWQAATALPPESAWPALEGLRADFDGLRGLAAVDQRIAALRELPAARAAREAAAEMDLQERRVLREFWALEEQLAEAGKRGAALAELRERWRQMVALSQQAEDGAERRYARRMLPNLRSSMLRGDAEYISLVEGIMPARTRRAQ